MKEFKRIGDWDLMLRLNEGLQKYGRTKESYLTPNLNNLGRIQQHVGRKKPGNVSMSYEVTFEKVINNLVFTEEV